MEREDLKIIVYLCDSLVPTVLLLLRFLFFWGAPSHPQMFLAKVDEANRRYDSYTNNARQCRKGRSNRRQTSNDPAISGSLSFI